MNTQLAFHETKFNVIARDNQIWFSAPQLAAALSYSDQSSVNRIYKRHSDEFTKQMSASVKLADPYGNPQDTRIFSLRGAHLIAMFARTPIAKEFRCWVLDILDHEVKQSHRPALSLSNDYGMGFFKPYLWMIGETTVRTPWSYPADLLSPNGDYPNPCGKLLAELKQRGYSVEAAQFQLMALQHHLETHRSKIEAIQREIGGLGYR